MVDRAQQRQRIDICQQLDPVVCRAVHMDGKARNDEKVPVDVHEPRLDAVFGVDQHVPRDRQRTVEPRRHQHAAVFFGRELQIVPRRRALGVFLDLKRRAVAVAGGQHKAVRCLFRHPERDTRRAAARKEILSAVRKAPACVFFQLRIARCQQPRADVFHHVIGAGAFLYKLQKLFCKGLFHIAASNVCCNTPTISCKRSAFNPFSRQTAFQMRINVI